MNNIRFENKLIELRTKWLSFARSLFLFGSPTKVSFGRKVRLTGQITFGNKVSIRDFSRIRGKEILIGDKVVIHENVFIRSAVTVKIGRSTTINRNTCILDHVIIGNYCSIAPNCVIVGSNHHFKDKSKTIKSQGSDIQGIILEDDVWVAANVTILDGVTIGKGSVIAAGAVVTKSVEPYSIVGGVPAKVIGKREDVSV